MRKLFLIYLLVPIICHAQDCQIGGDNHSVKVMSADSLKNRSQGAASYAGMTIDDMLTMTVSNPMDQNKAVRVTGYILDIKDGGSESCNCHSKVNRDTHIYVVKDASITDASKAIIAEATPRFRKQLGTTSDLKAKYLHHKVTITGYLFRDEEHKQNSAADNGKGLLWRGSCWEVHPVTSIQLQ